MGNDFEEAISIDYEQIGRGRADSCHMKLVFNQESHRIDHRPSLELLDAEVETVVDMGLDVHAAKVDHEETLREVAVGK